MSNAANLANQYGYAPGGNYYTWGQGGATQPEMGTQTQSAQNQTYNQAVQSAGLTGQFNDPNTWLYQPGSFVQTAPLPGSNQNGIGQIQADGTLKIFQTWDQYTAAGGTAGMIAQMPTLSSQQAAQLSTQYGGTGQGQGVQTQAAQAQAAQLAALQAGQTGTYINPTTGQSTETQAAIAQAANLAAQQAGLTGNYIDPTTGQSSQTLAALNQAANLTGMYNGAPTEAAYQFNQSQAQQLAEYQQSLQMQQAQLGQQYLSTASQLQGPQNTFQLSNYLRGAQGNPNVPTYLNALANNTNMAAFTAPGSTTPQQNTMGGLQQAMGAGGQNYYNQAAGSFANGGTGAGTGTGTGSAAGGQGTLSGWNYGDTLNAINNIASRGAQSLAPGSMEQLSPDEMQAFGSGLGAAGYDLSSFMNSYNASRVGQNAPVGAMGMSTT